MKRTILTGILALAAIAGILMAQQAPSAPAGQAPAAAQPAPAKPAGPHPKSPEELTALQALMAAQQKSDPDGIIKAGDDVLTKFADTDYKEMVLTLEAMAYEMKGDAVNEQVAWGRVMEVDPASIPANLKLGGLIAKQTTDKDLDRDDQLAKAEKCLNAAIAGIKAQQANPQTTPQAQAQLKLSDAEAHEDLGLVALTRATANKDADPKKYDKAITEMQAAANGDPDQAAYQARLAAVLESAGKSAEALALCDKILAMPNLNPAIQSFTTSVRNAAAKAAAPAK
jgi:tetratricopeptide (TPR) repeat protein